MVTTSIVRPNAAVIIWNYLDRRGTTKALTDQDNVDQIIINTLALKSIKTDKSKGAAGGSFSISLAPTRNWITAITPGSWIAILMCRTPITDVDLSTRMDARKLKFIGRVESVRVTTSNDQGTGTKISEYVVSGTSWDGMLNSALYIDPILRLNYDGKEGGAHEAAVFNQMNADQVDKALLSTTTELMQKIKHFWGKGHPVAKNAQESVSVSRIVEPISDWTMPLQLANWLNIKQSDADIQRAWSSNVGIETSIVDKIKIVSGALNETAASANNNKAEFINDSYHEVEDGHSFLQASFLKGMCSVWQYMSMHSNDVLNELVSDMRFDGFDMDSKMEFTIYKRVRPFITEGLWSKITADNWKVGDGGGDKGIEDLVSKLASVYSNLRRIEIPLHEIVAFDAGTNWRDKINFIELRMEQNLWGLDNKSMTGVSVVASDGQFIDPEAFTREGILPRFFDMKVMMTKTGSGGPVDLSYIKAWKYLLKEWYFDTHRMLNGTVRFVGLDKYIQVGDNIIIDSRILGNSQNTTRAQMSNKDVTYILAHVESVSNEFSSSENGTRRFHTTVSFIRGILVDVNGRPFGYDTQEGKLDQDTSIITPKEEKNNNAVFGTSGPNDVGNDRRSGN